MADIKLTKNSLKEEVLKLKQLERYLPTLELKKAMLQLEVQSLKEALQNASCDYAFARSDAESILPLIAEAFPLNIFDFTKVESIMTAKDNIAGVEVSTFQSITFSNPHYSLYDTPVWTEKAVDKLRELVSAKVKIDMIKARMQALEKEAREVSKRVNLFEKILIPRALTNIRKIKVYLSDMQLAQVSRAKVAKRLIEGKALCV